jgi:PAS domain S-box-containing protein
MNNDNSAFEGRRRSDDLVGTAGSFEQDLSSGAWNYRPEVAELFGLHPETAPAAFADWERLIFTDDVPKLRSAIQVAKQTGSYYVEFRVKHPDGTIRWLAGKGRAAAGQGDDPRILRGTYNDITERKELEARLLSLNETLEARVADLREEAHTLEVVNRTGVAVAAELDLERLVQMVTDAGVELTGAAFGAFFYNLLREGGEAYTLYTLSGAPREAFSKFPMPRNTEVFEPTFRGRGVVRSRDILADPRYGKNPRIEECPRAIFLSAATWPRRWYHAAAR